MILIRNIKQFQPANFLLIIFIGILLWFNPFISKDVQGAYIDVEPTPIYNWIYLLVGGAKNYLLCKIVAFIFIIVQVIIINVISNHYNLLGFRSYLPGLFYVVITANFPAYQLLHPILFANLFFLLSWERITSVAEKSQTYTSFFNSSVFLGIAVLFYPNYIYYLLILLIAPALNRISKAREYTMIILGFVTVWYFYLTINYIFYNKFQFTGIVLTFSFSYEELSELKPFQNIFLIFISVLILFSSLHLGTYISGLKIQIRRNLKILFIWFLFASILFLFTTSSLELIYSVAIPVAMLLSIFLMNLRRNWIAEVMWIPFLAISIINQFFPDLL